jgi:hypothetical protein
MRQLESLTRRGVLTLATGAGFARLCAFASDFWNKKEPADWTSDEIDQLTSKSPWAKDVSAQAQDQASAIPQPGVGAGGGTQVGGPIGGVGSRRGGGLPSSYRGTVRWESAKVILDAVKTPLPEAFSNHYVISVTGVAMNSGSQRRPPSQEGDSSSTANSAADMLERLKGVTYLEAKNKRDIQPGVALPHASGYDSVMFGFSKELLTIKPDDKEVTFSTQFGRVSVKTKFILKDMLYRGELSV